MKPFKHAELIEYRAVRRMILSNAGGFITIRTSFVICGEEGPAVSTERVRGDPGARVSFVKVLFEGSEVWLCLSTDTAMSKEELTLFRCGS